MWDPLPLAPMYDIHMGRAGHDMLRTLGPGQVTVVSLRVRVRPTYWNDHMLVLGHVKARDGKTMRMW